MRQLLPNRMPWSQANPTMGSLVVTPPTFRHLDDGRDRTPERRLVIVQGYLTARPNPSADQLAIRAIREAGWRGGIERFRWQAGHTGEIAMQLIPLAATAVLSPRPVTPLKALQAARLAALCGTFAAHWKWACLRADWAGRRLAEAIERRRAEHPGEELQFVGFSLGCRVLYRAMHRLACQSSPTIEQVHLFGGAHSRRADWETALQTVRGGISNYYSANDRVLNYLYRMMEWNTPMGLKPIITEDLRIENVDTATTFPGHHRYEESLHTWLNLRDG
ncbi:hypothetical protein Pan216_54810 [Planctomycetes bacterium Pan216]|uniref:DUF726 domain-containing protein n=1 Tax=Kolteria novifilia TaxID=2527975 RepID=A0A518BC92_9BACT|nr:hypothetical protein Pan216_54810 [Planctomycetes bacterium Pan216]